MFKQIRRKFHLPDADFIEETKTKSSFFKQDKAAFINFDSEFSDPFYDELVLLIESVENDTPDDILTAMQTQFAEVVDENMQLCRDKFNDAKHFIEKAFPKNRATWDAFGYKRYGKVRKSHLGLNSFMKTFHGCAIKYAAELIAKNYTQVMIDEIKTLQTALEDAICDHNLFIKSRSTAAADRISKMNELYDLVMQLCKAGKRIYKKNWAMQQRYLFKHFKKGKKLKVAA